MKITDELLTALFGEPDDTISGIRSWKWTNDNVHIKVVVDGRGCGYNITNNYSTVYGIQDARAILDRLAYSAFRVGMVRGHRMAREKVAEAIGMSLDDNKST